VYQQSEDAARSERRGLWQQENPIAPWEFVKEVAMRRNPVATLNAVAPARKPASDRPVSELTNLTLMASRIAAAPPPASGVNPSELPGLLVPVDGGNWRVLRPPRESFSAFVPEEGELKTVPIPGGDRVIDTHVYMGRDGRSAFAVSWFTGPTYGESDVDAIKYSLTSFLKGVGVGIDARNPGQGLNFSCELQNEKDISMRGFTGLEFDLTSCTIPARARVFSRAINGDRQMYIATVFYMEQNNNVARFINSFTITAPTKSGSQNK
jgi:hypothetical protein